MNESLLFGVRVRRVFVVLRLLHGGCLPSNYHLLSRFQPLCPDIQKLVHKVNLSLPRDFRGLVDAGVAVRVHHGGLLDLKQAHFHGPLGGHIIVAALGVADQIAVLPHPAEQPVLPDLHTVLAQQFCQLTYKDALLAGAYSIRKDALRGQLCNLSVLVRQ